MPANALVQTRINGTVKDEAAAVLATMGLTVSDAVRLMLTRVAHDKALPFEPLTPNAETIAAMQEARAGKTARFNSVDALMAELVTDTPLAPRYRDHALTGDWNDHRDCHVKPDLVLIYRKPDDDTLQLVRLGSHAELGW